MASDGPKQTILIKHLSTKSVTLYPTRAHITRDINDVILKPGTNEVEIYGLTPTVDEHSIQIEGRGAATIVDMTVDLVPNRDIFEEVYPEDSDESSDESEDEYKDSDDEDETVKALSKEIEALTLESTEAVETQNSANQRLMALDKYAKTVSAEHNNPDEVAKLLKKYEEDRAAIFKVHGEATRKIANLNKKIKRKQDEKFKAGKEGRKEAQRKQKQKEKEKRKKALQKAEKRKAARHIKQERLRYWPKKVYKVTLLLETSSIDTPASSRRGSMDSVTLAQSPIEQSQKGEQSGKETVIAFSLSYVTREAGWTPRYDLKISSLHKSAQIIYRTEFLNRTAETWKNAKIAFSTSQTSYQGLDDVVPYMHAWRVKLSRYDQGDGGLLSTEEAQKPRWGRPAVDNFNRSDLFGLENDYVAPLEFRNKQLQQQQQKAQGGGFFGASQQQAQKQTGGSQFGSYNTQMQQAQAFGSTNNYNSRHFASHGFVPALQVEEKAEGQVASEEIARGIELARASRRLPGAGAFSALRKKKSSNNDGDGEGEGYDPTIEDIEYQEELEFEESSWEDNGLTATYDVPGVRTLAPSSQTRRHKIASLTASNIHLSHISVPKLRAAAFLRAKIRNPSSSVTLLKGSAGVTLDGSFLGNMTLPRVSPGQLFDLPLGVDPGIHVSYPKPSVHRSTQGIIFNKEAAQVFTRNIWLNNTKSVPVELLVLDQIPVSEDERLRIMITTPKGLAKEGDSVRAGTSAKEGASGTMTDGSGKGEKWGKATATLKKNGEVSWTVNLEKAQACLLKLDYEARLPPSEKIVPA